MWSCKLFFAAVHFTLVAASISHFLTAAITFSCYSSNEIGLPFFISGASSFSVIHGYADFTVKSKKIIGFVAVVFFISKSGYAIYCRNAQVLEMQNFIPAYMKGWTYVRTPYGRFSQNQNFLDA